ncbi:DUF4054 domain-containing protein [Acidobacteria bacterium AB60]|nr:DUF4054 domain-containing protein [Acidobacteria bacterium AB60]
MITYAQFILDYPEFANASQAQFTLYQNRATQQLTCAWGTASPGTDPSQYTQYDIGMELVIAHFLARATIRARAVAAGGTPVAKGVVSSESAGPVSVNYDTAVSTEADAGHWNETDYGREYVQMARLMGAGPSQASPCPNPNPLNGPAWSGVPYLQNGFAS